MTRKKKKVSDKQQVIDEEFTLEAIVQAVDEIEKKRKIIKKKKATRKARKKGESEILSYRHKDKRKNNPEVGMVKPENDPDEPRAVWKYDSHIDPELQFDIGRSQIEKLIDDALESGDDETMRTALQELKRLQQPYLNWAGKAERTSFEFDTVSLHVHERIDPASILSAVRKKMIEGSSKGVIKASQPDLFAAPFENLPLRDAIDFYKHERGWANRLIAGDSLLVMNSLLKKESMAGQVQMVYIDPPYGITYKSNFQPFINKKDVTDRKDEDLNQEPEMIKAFRDTWELGIHSYLTYLRDRLLLSKELLGEAGSIFIQISDENVHLIRNILDDVFGANNFVAEIRFRKKTMPLGSKTLEQMCDYLVWYAKDKEKLKFKHLFYRKDYSEDFHWDNFETSNGERKKITKAMRDSGFILPDKSRVFRLVSLWPTTFSQNSVFPVLFKGKEYYPASGQCWPTSPDNMKRLIKANQIELEGENLRKVLYEEGSDYSKFTTDWMDTVGARDRKYVVQTSEKVVERCLLMTTDPGDLILDPTCGSGTTAIVAEQWGRRWITTDTSRVAVSLAKQRLMTSGFDYYALRYPHEGLKSGFIYKIVQHVTLKSIANNPEIDTIYEKMHPTIEDALVKLNKSLKKKLKEWEIPFHYPGDWPVSAKKPFDDFHAARQAMQKKMDDSITAHADQEILFDQLEVDKTKLRISGPFTVEAVPAPTVLSLDDADKPQEADVAIARSGESLRQHEWRDELLRTGVRGKGGQDFKFAELETLPELPHLHATGHLDSGERVVLSFGPEHAAMEQKQVELALREAEKLRPSPKYVVFAAFEFDPEAAKDIDETNWSGVTLLRLKMDDDLHTHDLKKKKRSGHSFWLMGQPDIEVHKQKDGTYIVEVHGFDYFDTKSGELVSGGKNKIAAWMLDTDYDERSLYPQQVFFPMAGKKDGWNKLKKDIKAELNESLLDQFHGTKSLPFEAGENNKIAVKIVDDRGIESLKIIPLN